MPKLYINRRSAMEHRCDPSLDAECKNSIFMQIYEGLKPRDRTSKPLNYRLVQLYLTNPVTNKLYNQVKKAAY